jgi:tRNA(Arg) A34 adenosine deaminase TadA
MVESTPTPAEVVLSHYSTEIDDLRETTPTERNDKAKLRERGNLAIEQFAKFHEALTAQQALDSVYLTGKQKAFAKSLGYLFDMMHKVRMKLAGKVPTYTTPEGGVSKGTVKCVATLTVDCAPGQRPYPGDIPANTSPTRSKWLRERNSRHAHAIAPEDLRTGQVGGFVVDVAQATRQSRKRLEIVTRSTGDEDPSTHAETRLLAQIEKMGAQDPAWKYRVRAIEINLSHSPCTDCTRALAGTGTSLYEFFADANVELLMLTWGRLWTGARATTQWSVRDLEKRFVIRGQRPNP